MIIGKNGAAGYLDSKKTGGFHIPTCIYINPKDAINIRGML